MTETAVALAPRDWRVETLTDELLSEIEPARERAAIRAEAQRQLDENDQRVWMIRPFYFSNEEEPDTIEDLSTDDVRELIMAGEVKGKDWIFQSYRAPDPDSGELYAGSEAWDLAWTKIQDVSVFEEELSNAPEEP